MSARRTHSLSFGQAVKAARDAAGLTQAEAASAMGVEAAHICRMERGNRLPTLPTMVRLARALGVPAMSLAAAAIGDVEAGRHV